jgi:hypothetical protein
MPHHCLASKQLPDALTPLPCACRKPDRVSRGALVFVDQSTEKVAPKHSSGRSIGVRGDARSWRLHAERSMGSVGVVVLGKDAKHRLEMTTPEDEKSVQAFAPQRADKRPRWRSRGEP